MKKKIIGIILTAVMVLTMLPALALPTKAGIANSHQLEVWKDGEKIAEGEDYTWAENKLRILNSGLTIKGSTNCEYIWIGKNASNVTLENLNIIPDEETSKIQKAIEYDGQKLEIKLKGKNTIGVDPSNQARATVLQAIYSDKAADIKITSIDNASLNIYTFNQAIYNVSNEAIFDIGDIEIVGGTYNIKTSMKNKGYGIVANNKLLIKDANVTIKSVNVALGAQAELKICGQSNVKVWSNVEKKKLKESANEVSSAPKIDATAAVYIIGGGISIEDKSQFSVEAVGINACALLAFGNLDITTSGEVNLKSKTHVAAAIMEDMKIGENANVVMHGSYDVPESDIKFGALACVGEVEIPEELLLYGAENAEYEFDKTLITAPADIMTIEDSFMVSTKEIKNCKTCSVKKDGEDVRANTLVIKAPKVPETGDTNSMILWIVLGLVSLVIAAGIFVSRKQRD